MNPEFHTLNFRVPARLLARVLRRKRPFPGRTDEEENSAEVVESPQRSADGVVEELDQVSGMVSFQVVEGGSTESTSPSRGGGADCCS